MSIMSTWSAFDADLEVSVIVNCGVSGGVATMRGTSTGSGVDWADGGLLRTLLVCLFFPPIYYPYQGYEDVLVLLPLNFRIIDVRNEDFFSFEGDTAELA